MNTQTINYPALTRAIEKQGWELDAVITVYRKCFSGVKLQGDEYAIGKELQDIGFMSVAYSPIWKRGCYVGQSVCFTSIDPTHF
jgi:hypothetical protein